MLSRTNWTVFLLCFSRVLCPCVSCWCVIYSYIDDDVKPNWRKKKSNKIQTPSSIEIVVYPRILYDLRQHNKSHRIHVWNGTMRMLSTNSQQHWWNLKTLSIFLLNYMSCEDVAVDYMCDAHVGNFYTKTHTLTHPDQKNPVAFSGSILPTISKT